MRPRHNPPHSWFCFIAAPQKSGQAMAWPAPPVPTPMPCTLEILLGHSLYTGDIAWLLLVHWRCIHPWALGLARVQFKAVSKLGHSNFYSSALEGGVTHPYDTCPSHFMCDVLFAYPYLCLILIFVLISGVSFKKKLPRGILRHSD